MATLSVNAAAEWGQYGLASLNAILGSTESSRAVAAILTLMRDEFQKPEPDGGESVGYLDLFVGTVGFVLLQRWGRRKTNRQFIDAGGEEIIWDAVIDDNGFRADVVGTQTHKAEYFDGVHTDSRSGITRSVSFVSPGGDRPFEAVPRASSIAPRDIPLALSARSQSPLTDAEIKQNIMQQLPEGTRVMISSEVITARTVKVEIYNSDMVDIVPPPGTVLISEQMHHDSEGPALTPSEDMPRQTVMFQTALHRSGSSELKLLDKFRLTTADTNSPENAIQDDQKPFSSDSDGDELFMSDASEASRRKNGKDTLGNIRIAEPSSLGSALANQKRPRIPPSESTQLPTTKVKDRKKTGTKSPIAEPVIGNIRKAFKSLAPTGSPPGQSGSQLHRSAKGSHTQAGSSSKSMKREPPRSGLPRLSSDILRLSNFDKALPQIPVQQASPTTRKKLLSGSDGKVHRSPLYSQDGIRNSFISQTDTFSMTPSRSRSGSPTFTRTRVTTTTTGLGKTSSENHIWANQEPVMTPAEYSKHHRRSKSHVPSLYSVQTKGSEGPLIIAAKVMPRQSVFEDQENVTSLIRDGKVPGIFPDNHLIRNVRRYVRFSSASYGSNFLRFMGLTDPATNTSSTTDLKKMDSHHEHQSFSNYTGLPQSCILLSSFVDPFGVVTPMARSQDGALPLVHYVSVDVDSRAVVLTCRGTLGFEDVLTDMMCDYDDLYWRGTPYKVHKGIHASARRLLAGTGSRVMATLKAALEEYPDFGIVLCGHSLGGAVAALLAVLISEPRTNETTSSLFQTVSQQKLLAHPNLSSDSSPPINLPAGRPIHVYAYGPPATMSASLRVATRGLITTIINDADIVPSLSLGLLYDFKSIALHLKSDTSDAVSAIRSRVLERIKNSITSHFYVDQPAPPEPTAGDGLGEDAWAWAALKTLRSGMPGEKLMPPGEIFVVESMRVFDRSSSEGSGDYYPSLGRAATRVTLKYIRDVETRFGELRFGSKMFSDHSPGRYEASLTALGRGILEDDL